MLLLKNGVQYYPEFFDPAAQAQLLEKIRAVVKQAPLFRPAMPNTGKAFSVRMTNCGPLGWVSDAANGYRYQATHPDTGNPWPKAPEVLSIAWDKLSDYPHPFEACLINHYESDAKMGLHQDRDEETFEAPVISISLGDSCLFRLGNTSRGGKTQSLKLNSGDVIVLGGEARMLYHGVDRIYPDSCGLLTKSGRINLTLRRVTSPNRT